MGMSFGRGGPRVWVPWWLVILALPIIAAAYLAVAVVWLLAHLAAAIVYGTVWLVQRGVEVARRRDA
jgi:hypothetical protein